MSLKNNITDVYYCQLCKHFWYNGKCEAFPEGIPQDILSGEDTHTKPLPKQGNDIVFEPINNDK